MLLSGKVAVQISAPAWTDVKRRPRRAKKHYVLYVKSSQKMFPERHVFSSDFSIRNIFPYIIF